MEVKQIFNDKKRFLELLLLADEQESMIDKYLERGAMFALYDGDLKSICVVTEETAELCEIKNIATVREYQGQGYGKYLIQYITNHYRNHYKAIQVGTGDCPSILSFYKGCGFSFSHSIKNFFTDNYDHPIFEEGKQLIDMIYLKKVFE